MLQVRLEIVKSDIAVGFLGECSVQFHGLTTTSKFCVEVCNVSGKHSFEMNHLFM